MLRPLLACSTLLLLAGCMTQTVAQTRQQPAPPPTASANERQPVTRAAGQRVLQLRAESSNAMGVTGNILFSQDRIVFETGASLLIEPVAPKVWRVTRQLDRGLKENGTLCGRADVRYITLHTDPAGLYILNVVTENRQPATPREDEFLIDGTCAVYAYAREN